MDNRKKKGLNGPGFYIALCCCVIAIGMAGYFTSRNEETNPDNVMEVPSATQTPAAATPIPTVAVESAAPAPQTEAPAVQQTPDTAPVSGPADIYEPEDSGTDAIDYNNENIDIIEAGEPVEFYDGEVVDAVTINEDPVFLRPVEGEIAEALSKDNLVYNKALGDWRTHNGVDITAEAGTDVVASLDGVIEQAYVDVLGNTILIDHQNGYKTRYVNLESIDGVEVGAQVKKGDVIGKVGNYTLGENVTSPHIHFEIIFDDSYLDPEAFFE